MKRIAALLLIAVLIAGAVSCARSAKPDEKEAHASEAAPTAAPTASGGENKTAEPARVTDEPTSDPTSGLTAEPAELLTEEPAAEPTAQVTAAPTSAPTGSAAPSTSAAPSNSAAPTSVPGPAPTPAPGPTATPRPTSTPRPIHTPGPIHTPVPTATSTPEPGSSETVHWNSSWRYADRSVIHTGTATLYHTSSTEPKHFVVAVNAGHGTSGGTSVYTLCHPDGSPKVTGGSTPAGSIYAVAVSSGTVMLNGASEASVTLSLAKKLKTLLLNAGFDVLMIRESSDVQLDNVARTVMANNVADCHIALHYDSSERDKGLYVCNVAQVTSYLNMEPVKSHHHQHETLANCMIAGARAGGVKIYGSGSFEFDLTQTSYSTVPSANIEVGDKASDTSSTGQYKVAQGLVYGVMNYYSAYVAGNGAADDPEADSAARLEAIPRADEELKKTEDNGVLALVFSSVTVPCACGKLRGMRRKKEE